jgi:hypothetical protein
MRNPFLRLYYQILDSDRYSQFQKKEFLIAWKRSFNYGIEFTAGDWLTILPPNYYGGSK